MTVVNMFNLWILYWFGNQDTGEKNLDLHVFYICEFNLHLFVV